MTTDLAIAPQQVVALNKNYQKEKNLSKFIHWERQMVLK